MQLNRSHAFSHWPDPVAARGAVLSRRSWLGSAAHALIDGGPVEVARRSVAFVRNRIERGRPPYRVWRERHEALGVDRAEVARSIAAFRRRPVVSILMPVSKPEISWLAASVQSLRAQSYPDWELCIALDGPQEDWVPRALARWAASDSRICVTSHAQSRSAGMARAAALSMATGPYVALVEPSDLLAPDALFRIVERLQADDADLVYSDEDKLTPAGERVDPFFKPDWSPSLLLSLPYTLKLAVYRRDLLLSLGGFCVDAALDPDYDLALRVAEAASRIAHVPHVLYHHREAPLADPTRREAGRQAIAAALDRRGISGRVSLGSGSDLFRVHRELRHTPLVSVLVPTRDGHDLLRECVEGLLDRTDYDALEVVVMDHQSRDFQTRRYLTRLAEDCRVRVVPHSGDFNYSAINNRAAARARGDYLVLMNNDVEIRDRRWLKAVIAQAEEPGVGIVAPKLLYPDGRVQHGGVVLGVGGVAANAFDGSAGDDSGYRGFLEATREYSAVTGACLVTRRSDYLQLNGLDETSLPVSYSDVDYCLRAGRAGLRTVFCPESVLTHHGSATRERGADASESTVMRCRWSGVIDEDPYYSPHLARDRADFWLRL